VSITVKQTYLNFMQSVRFRVFISSVFLNAANIIFEKKNRI